MRVAWFVPSGIAPVESAMHIPILTGLASNISGRVDLTVFSFSEATTPHKQLDEVPVHYLPVSWRDPLAKRGSVLWSAFSGEHRRHAFDVLHGFWGLPCGSFAALFGKLVRKPSVATFLGGETAHLAEIGYGAMLSWRLRKGIEWTCRQASAIHLLTQYQRVGLERFGMGFPGQRVFPLGIDTNVFRWTRKTPAPPYRFLHVANLNDVKDQRTLLAAFKIISDHVPAKLRIVGPDFMNGSLQHYARELEIEKNTEFTGHVSHPDLTRHYRWAHILLQSSLHEGQGISVLEAMASGVAVCGTNVGILPELPDSCVSTVACGKPEELAAAALSLLRRRRFTEVTNHARKWTEEHDMGKTIGKVIDLYSELEVH